MNDIKLMNIQIHGLANMLMNTENLKPGSHQTYWQSNTNIHKQAVKIN